MQIAFIGFGEAAAAIVEGWGPRAPHRIRAFDIKTDMPALAEAKWADYARYGVDGSAAATQALADAELVFSLVTADQTGLAASTAAAGIPPGCLYLDGNSCAPAVKKRAAETIEAAGGRYVDMAIMAPIRPRRHRTPVLLSGPQSRQACEVLRTLDMAPASADGPVGAASTVKMLRSVMVKGLEALFAETVLAARRAAVDAEVLASLQASFPGFVWEEQAAYNLERMLTHGARRAAEMEDAAATLQDLGVEPLISAGTAEWQRKLGALDAEGLPQGNYRALADGIIRSLRG